MALKGNGSIEFVQGQTYEYTVIFPSTTAALVSKLYITSKKLNLQGEFVRQTGAYSNRFKYVFSAANTALYPSGKTTYDVTAQFSDGTVEIETGLPLEVISRQNPVRSEEE